MARKQSRYQLMQTYVTRALLIDSALFILYLIVAGAGVVWLKVILSILTLLLSLLIAGFLYMCGELLKKRSLWMGTTAVAIFICTFASLILNFPSPV